MNDVFDPFTQLERSHRRLEERLDELVQASAGARSPEALDVARDVAGFCARAVKRHEEDEESSLFPRLREQPALAPLLEKLAREHREHEVLHARLDDAVSALAADASRVDDPASPGVAGLRRIDDEAMKELADVADALVRAYRAHIEEEERLLFPAARAALDAAAIEGISREMEGRRGGGGRRR